jgi:hypothetical protein
MNHHTTASEFERLADRLSQCAGSIKRGECPLCGDIRAVRAQPAAGAQPQPSPTRQVPRSAAAAACPAGSASATRPCWRRSPRREG